MEHVNRTIGDARTRKSIMKGTTDCVRYTYKDIVYIVNSRTQTEITCYARPTVLTPIPITTQMEIVAEKDIQKVQNDLDCWTSHTVMVIDISGSMRASDVWGTRNHLKAVWFSVALDYIADRLERGNASSTYVISILTMGDHPTLVYKEEPTSWVLYNKIVSLYSTRRFNPKGHGNFLPSLAAAEALLKRNSNASCNAALLFLSDGAPSDGGPMVKECIVEKVESLAKSFGRRLSFTAIGIGQLDDWDLTKHGRCRQRLWCHSRV
jgi:von Willebrand factor type A domain